MSETTREKAAQALAEIENVTAVILPEPAADIVPLTAAPTAVAIEIRSRMEKTWVEVESFMTKPPDFERLFSTLRSLIDTRRRKA